MRDDFTVLILTHGRPDNQKTHKTLRDRGYTGPIVFICDDHDGTVDDLRAAFPDDRVVVFDKGAASEHVDDGDPTDDLRAVVYARNAVWDLVRELGYRYFIELDDDYYYFGYRFNDFNEPANGPVKVSMDEMFEAYVEFLENTPPSVFTICTSQGGDWIGGHAGKPTPRFNRKAMNTFVCDVERPFPFLGKINEDVTSYVSLGSKGGLFFTDFFICVSQGDTQQNSGGLTDIYLDVGTYTKSFYTVLWCPSSVKVGVLLDGQGKVLRPRFHHRISWDHAVPKILREEHRKSRNT